MIEKAKPSQKGVLFIPESKHEIHSLAKVVEVGNGRLPDGKTKELLVKPGEIIFFQTNAMMAAACTYEVDGKAYLNLHQDDLIARLPSNEVSEAAFEPLGRWCLIKPSLRASESIIALPEATNYQEHADFYCWRFLRGGSLFDLPVELNQEVLVNQGRANPFQIGNETFCYIDKDFIFGTVDANE